MTAEYISFKNVKEAVKLYTGNEIYRDFNEETRKLSKGIRWEDYPYKVLKEDG